MAGALSFYEELSPSTRYASYQGNFCLEKLDLSSIAALYVLCDEYKGAEWVEVA